MYNLLIKGQRNHSKLISFCFFVAEFLFRSSRNFNLISNRINSVVFQGIQNNLSVKNQNKNITEQKLAKIKKGKSQTKAETENLIYINFVKADLCNLGDIALKMHLHPESNGKLGKIKQTSILEIDIFTELTGLENLTLLNSTKNIEENEIINFVSTGLILGGAINSKIEI